MSPGLSFLIGVIFGFISGVIYTMYILSLLWQQEAIRRGYAEYAKNTGEWRWKEDPTT